MAVYQGTRTGGLLGPPTDRVVLRRELRVFWGLRVHSTKGTAAIGAPDVGLSPNRREAHKVSADG